MNRVVFHLFRLLLLAAAVSLFVFLGWKEFAPTGTLTLRAQTGEPSPFFSRFLPDTRTEEIYLDVNGSSFVPIVGDPAYLTLTPPSDFDEVEFELTYKNKNLPMVELGILTDEEADAYRLKPLENQLLDELDWPSRREGDVVLYDRHERYETLADFLVAPPPLEEIAAYHYRFDRPFSILRYTPHAPPERPPVRQSHSGGTSSGRAGELRTLDLTLRGEHELLTYIERERLNFTFDYMDMNRTLGEDPVTILVFDSAGELVAGKTNEDDGNTGAGGEGSDMRNLHVEAELQDGVYKIILKVNRDIFFRRITTSQQKLTFLNQLFLGDEVGYQPAPRQVSFITEAKNMSFETQHAEGVQEAAVAGASVSVEEPFLAVRHRVRAPGIVSATVPKGDLLIRGAGHYAFSREMYFNPDPVRLEWNTDLDALGINYVIATYMPPETEGDLVRARASFFTEGVPKIRGAWKFALSLPGVYDVGESIDVVSVKAVLRREPMSLGDLTSRTWKKLCRTLGLTSF